VGPPDAAAGGGEEDLWPRGLGEGRTWGEGDGRGRAGSWPVHARPSPRCALGAARTCVGCLLQRAAPCPVWTERRTGASCAGAQGGAANCLRAWVLYVTWSVTDSHIVSPRPVDCRIRRARKPRQRPGLRQRSSSKLAVCSAMAPCLAMAGKPTGPHSPPLAWPSVGRTQSPSHGGPPSHPPTNRPPAAWSLKQHTPTHANDDAYLPSHTADRHIHFPPPHPGPPVHAALAGSVSVRPWWMEYTSKWGPVDVPPSGPPQPPPPFTPS
jgi:hypothetical protein